MNRKTLLFTAILLVVVSICSVLVFMNAQKNTAPLAVSSEQPDFFMTDAVYTDFDQNGEIHNQISTTKITHFVAGDAYFFDNPKLLMFNVEQNPWIISADKGKSEHGKEKVFLWDNVIIHQDAGKKNANTTIITTDLTIFPQTKTASTTKPVTITQDRSSMSAIGANADFRNGTVSLLSKVQGNYKGD